MTDEVDLFAYFDEPRHGEGYEYIPAFLTPDETEALYRICASLEYKLRANPRNPDTHIRHQAVVFSEYPAERALRLGIPTFRLAVAPKEIPNLAAKLTAYVGNGRRVNYLSVVRYLTGEDFINWHQHGEDKGHDTPVLL